MKMPDMKGVNWKDVFIGDYDWAFLCTPRLPWAKSKQPPPFYAKDEKISVFVAFIMGLQHCLAMVGGIITVPLLVSGAYTADFSPDGRAYLISAALIVSGIASLIQVCQIKIPYTPYVIGSGLLSVMGISFTFLPIAQSAIPKLTQCSVGGVPCVVNGDQNPCPTGPSVVLEGSCLSGQEAYGQLLGTVLVCCWLEVAIAFIPLKTLRYLFPPVVTGTTVLLIGIALAKTGISYWGGGAYCADQVLTSQALCNTNGQVQLPFGSSEYVGLGFVVFFTLILVELFGSPFMRNISVALGLLVGMIVASSVSYNSCTTTSCNQTCSAGTIPAGVAWSSGGNTSSFQMFPNSTICFETCTPTEPMCTNQRYVTGDLIASSKWITFLWVNTFPLGFYAPVVLPMLFGFMVTSMECIGDVTATTEASGLIPVGEDYERAVQGGILADGLNCFWSALATTLPCTTYAQNNGIISLTRCGARRAGIACGILLIIFGIIQKFASIILTIPDCVLGGMTSFLFINVAISGMRILTLEGGINRRNRFIAAMSLTLGIGVELVPAFFNIAGQPTVVPLEGHFWPIDPNWTAGFAGFRDALIIVLTTGFSIGGFTALLLNLILPYDADDVDELAEDLHAKTKMRTLEEEYPHPHMEMVKDPLHPNNPEHPPIHVEAVPENLGAASSTLPTSTV